MCRAATHALELQRVRGLVQRDPTQQLTGVGIEIGARLGEVGSYEQQARRHGRVEQHQLVLAEHVARHVAEQRPDLSGHHDTRHRTHRPVSGPSSEPRRSPSGWSRGEAANVGVDPTPPSNASGRGSEPGGRRPV